MISTSITFFVVKCMIIIYTVRYGRQILPKCASKPSTLKTNSNNSVNTPAARGLVSTRARTSASGQLNPDRDKFFTFGSNRTNFIKLSSLGSRKPTILNMSITANMYTGNISTGLLPSRHNSWVSGSPHFNPAVIHSHTDTGGSEMNKNIHTSDANNCNSVLAKVLLHIAPYAPDVREQPPLGTSASIVVALRLSRGN